MVPKVQVKEKKQTGLHQNLKLLCFKGHHQETEPTYRRKYLQIIYLIMDMYLDYINSYNLIMKDNPLKMDKGLE